MDVTKEEMKQKPKCPLRSGLLSSPTVYRKEKVTQQFWYLVITLKNLFVSSKQMEIKSCLTHIHTHTAESWIAVSLLLCFFEAPSHHHRSNTYKAELPQQRLTNQSTPTTNLTTLREPLPPTGRQGAASPPPTPQTG